ncbi:DUF4167 domain-containing protein [Litorisediminicola beolgyonensis]|uniref:DUF4167 domain-containing protein n=1 Tax=Litorisediminicola beolgyonensis TaxID=1173614 RepID=A0ABW3ZLB8_9RHOB
MRSSNKRSRSKSNRNRNTVGNVVNRVFDSSGPDGKVRGTPQQIIDKYNQLARDSQLSGDRVATENFQQHAEHYLRMLSEAQREQNERREQQERENRERQAQRDRERSDRQDDNGGNDNNGGNNGHSDGGNGSGGGQHDGSPEASEQPETKAPKRRRGGGGGGAEVIEPEFGESSSSTDVVDLSEDDEDSGLVDTPENASQKPKRKPRRKASDAPKADNAAE